MFLLRHVNDRERNARVLGVSPTKNKKKMKHHQEISKQQSLVNISSQKSSECCVHNDVFMDTSVVLPTVRVWAELGGRFEHDALLLIKVFRSRKRHDLKIQ